ncbi:hypothetical protein OR571_16410 [Psychrobacillus sp. NEAU-3TGS]|uniref:hypothetical protein n=1 Tax=Psychrobacillus sp. NEAU-3TGS TaxID=2995412 RepID=UPI002496A002|nr:hypothetical protein [Psychrobacillus sp. NEAU-3TGS]MDI2588644.1 hypothetical protein [Psychrobacillus sp. NEAU-3TGS]
MLKLVQIEKNSERLRRHSSIIMCNKREVAYQITGAELPEGVEHAFFLIELKQQVS